MEGTKEFTTAAVISAITGRLLCPIEDLYAVLAFLIGRGVYTHELGMAGERCYQDVVRQHPALAEIDVTGVTRENWCEELARFEGTLGSRLCLRPLGWNELADRSPLETLRELVPDEKIIVLSPKPEEDA